MARLLKLALEEITRECDDNAERSRISNDTSRRVHEGFGLGPHRHGSTSVSEVEARSETLFRRMRRSSGSRLYVSNLDLRVTDSVIELMFSGVGKLISHLVHRDESGNPKVL